MATIDVDAYFQRIGYTGGRAPTLETLRAIHLRHAETIPFENLNPLLKWPVKLDPASIERKLVHERRGGYCFEQNQLLRHALEGLGFRVSGLAARVLWYVPDGVTPRTHMVLRVKADGEEYIADVGFGSQTLTGPLRLVPDVAQDTPHGPFRLRPVGGEFVMESEIRGEWRPLYRFDLSEHHPIDYEVANWYVSTCPASQFTTTLIAARPAPGKRYVLRDNDLGVHTRDGTERRILTSAAELREALTGVFGIALPEGPELDVALERAAAKPRPVG
ncbi:MAG: arylamine N-acetyltransferase [Planctomycetes bacterium]|nr:arylamine N-acetyltransferase [Planctomycetota bacterium]